MTMPHEEPDAPAPHLKGGCGERSTFGRSCGVCEEHSGARSTGDSYDWPARLAAIVAAATAKKERRRALNAAKNAARTHGLARRHHNKLNREDTMTNDFADAVTKALQPAPDRTVRCRYLDRLKNQCTGEAVDPNGEILLCTTHLARAMELLHRTTQAARRIPTHPTG